jgi:uncharacterized radical SAM superfamily Fe-S cluster-containing enzyme
MTSIPLELIPPRATAAPDFGQGRPIKTTTSLCPVCLARIPADVRERDGQVWMDKTCPAHGPFTALLASDVRHYYQADPRLEGLGACCGPGRHCGDQLANHSCVLLIEITQRCNLTCPTCYADSSPERTEHLSRDAFAELLDGLLARGKGSTDVLQLSGGEPTIHPEFFDLVDLALARGVRQVYINTNGIRLAGRPFAEALAARRDRVSVYLQFDGFRTTTHELLRGRGDLLQTKLTALDHCEELGLGVVPVMTLTRDVNDDELGRFLAFASARPKSVHKVMIQPAMYSGRYDNPRRVDRLTLADVARRVAEQTGGLFSEDDFTPIPCSDPNCFSIAVALRGPDGLIPVSRYLPRYRDWASTGAQKAIAAVTDVFDRPGDLAATLAWACSSGALDSLDEATVDRLLGLLAALPAPAEGERWHGLFAIGVKPFMDATTYDQDRIDKCCVHIVGRDGVPVSFCEYNAINRPLGRL